MKQAIVLRADLKISRGKLVAQACHASLSAALEARKKKRRWFDLWIEQGQKKVVLKARDKRELMSLYKKARGLPCSLISDAGLTELRPWTITSLGIGPAPDDKIDKITGSLPLLK